MAAGEDTLSAYRALLASVVPDTRANTGFTLTWVKVWAEWIDSWTTADEPL